MITRVLVESDAQQYQKLRLEALKSNPEAFGSTYERESKYPLELVIERISPSRDKFVMGALDELGSLEGIVALVRENGVKTSHKANLYGMYVSEKRRGNGIGRILLRDLIKKAKEIDGLEQIKLSVVSTNEPARKLYRSVGFETYGLERNALKFDGEYFDEDLMVLRLP